MTSKRKKNVSYNDIRSLEEDWALDSRNGYPYSGESVQAFIKKMFGSKAGEFYYDSDTTKYLVFADADSRDLFLSDREEHADLLIGSFDAPANYVAEISMTTPIVNTILEGDTGNYIDFTFDIKTKTGSSTGEAVIATYTFNNGGNIIKETRIYDAGTNVHFLADEYLSVGTNRVSVSIRGRDTFAGTMSAVTFTVVNLELTSNFAYSTPVNKGTYLHVPYNLKGANVKYLEWYIDGVKLEDVDTVIGLNVNAIKNIDTSDMLVGKHSIQARAFITEGGTNYYSKTLYFDFLVCPASGLWEEYVTFVLLGIVIDSPLTSGTLTINIKQYDTFDYTVAVFDSRSRSLSLVITDNGNAVKSIAATDSSIISESYSTSETGNHVILFTCDGHTATFTAVAQESDIDIVEESSDVLLKLSAKGRSNNESNPATWSYQQTAAQGGNLINTTFTGFSWNAVSGWNNDALLIPAGASIQIGLNPLAGNPITRGRTIEIDFETSKILDETASIISLLSGTTGLSVTASTAKLQTAGGTSVDTKFRDGDRIRLSFVINRRDDAENARMLYIINNGILERAAQFSNNDTIGISGDTLTIGSAGCNIKLYSIIVYDKPLRVDQAFQNYAINSPNIISIASFNDIYDGNGGISVDKVNSHIPVMIITGDISSIMAISDKSHKNDWNANPVDIEFRNMQNPQMNFYIEDADIRLQGTSSISYPRKNFRIYSKSKSGKYQTKFFTPTHNNSDLVEGGKYAFKSGAAPVTCWCLKADFAESSGSHNTGVSRLWNSVMKSVVSGGDYILRTNAQKWAEQNSYEYDVRTTIDGFPIVLFQRDSENSPLICLGQYNFNNDKSTEEVFGFTALSKPGVTPFDNSHVECWEVLDSDNEIALFTDVSDFDTDWSNAFEARYPDKNTNVTALKTVSVFLNSCYDSANDTVDVAAWRAGKASHFDLNKLAAYYIYLLRFGAVDQTVKNAMFTTEDGVHWFYINYDNDTILGIDNESRQFDTWDYGLFTQTPQGGYYYAGKGKSVLWRLFEADSECLALARQIDALLFSAGLTYENILEMFDDLQSSQWCERIYNENGRYKYVSQALDGQNVLHMLQGSRKSHRHWWLQHRLEKYDNTFGNGTYSIRSIQARATGTVNIPQGSAYKFTPAISSNFGYAVASTVVDAPTPRTAGTEYTATGLPQDTGVGNLIYIYNANNIAAIDLSAYISALGSLNIGDAIDVNGDSRLIKLVLGDGTNTNSYLTAISGLSTVKSLEEIDIRGYQAITNMDLSALVNLKTFKATGSGLTSFAPANSVNLLSALLPDTIQSIVLNRANVTAITYTPTTTLRTVELVNVTGSWDAKTFVNTWLALLSDAQLANAELTLTGINWTGMTAAQVIKMGSVGTNNLQGKVTLTSITPQEYDDIVAVFGENVFSPNSQFIIDAPAGVYITGPSQVLSGDEGRFVATAFPVSENAPLFYLYDSSQTQITANGTDAKGFYYYTGSIKLYRDTGLLVVDSNLASDTTVKIRVRINNTATWSDYVTVQCNVLVMPTISISGAARIREIGSYDYPFTLGTYNAELQRIEVSVTAPSSVATVGLSGSKAVLNVLTIQGENTYTLRVSAVCKQGTVYTDKSVIITDSEVIMDSNSNPEVLAVCYAQGWCARSDQMTATEALNVTDIGTAFQNNTQITHFEEFVYFRSVSVLQQNAFNGCWNLTTLELPDSITKCNQYCFQNCANLSHLKLPNSNLQMSQYVFGGYGTTPSKLQTAGLIGSGCNIEFAWTNIPSCAFSGCSSLKSIVFPEGVISIGVQAFSNCGLSGTVEIPATVTTVESQAFSNCSSIRKLIVHKNTSVDGSFIATNLQTAGPIGGDYDLEFGWETAIPRNAFMMMSNLTSITIPSCITSIGHQAFYYCSNLTKLYISDISSWLRVSMSSYTSAPFSSTASDSSKTKHVYVNGVELHDLIIPNSITSIGDYHFYGWACLDSVIIPNSVTSIGAGAFQYCKGLTSITIPSSVTSIGNFALDYCTKLETITCLRSSAPTVQSSTFGTSSSSYTGKDVQGTKTLYVPAGATGYNSGAWADPLQASDKCNFVLSATL